MDDPRPSRQIYAELKRRMADGRLPAGTRLNIGLIADEFETTRTTVGKAMKQLESDGLIVMFGGLGWYVNG